MSTNSHSSTQPMVNHFKASLLTLLLLFIFHVHGQYDYATDDEQQPYNQSPVDAEKRGGGRTFQFSAYKRGGGRAFQFADDKRGGGRAFIPDDMGFKRGGGRAFQFADDKRGGGRAFVPDEVGFKRGGGRAFQFADDKRGGGRAFSQSDKRGGGRGFQSFSPDVEGLKRGGARSFSSYYGGDKRAGARPFFGWWKRGGARYFADSPNEGFGLYDKRAGARHFDQYAGMKRGGARAFRDDSISPPLEIPMKKTAGTANDESSLGSPPHFAVESPQEGAIEHAYAEEEKRGGARSFRSWYGSSYGSPDMKRAGARMFPIDDESKEKRRMLPFPEPQN